jgi:hypothetical protein
MFLGGWQKRAKNTRRGKIRQKLPTKETYTINLNERPTHKTFLFLFLYHGGFVHCFYRYDKQTPCTSKEAYATNAMHIKRGLNTPQA